MATPQDLISSALKRIGVHSKGQSLDAEDLQDGLNDLNRLLAEWKLSGIDVGQEEYANASATLKIPLKYHRGIISNLALSLSAEYGVPPSPIIAEEARMGTVMALRESQQDIVLDMPSGIPVGNSGYDIDYDY